MKERRPITKDAKIHRVFRTHPYVVLDFLMSLSLARSLSLSLYVYNYREIHVLEMMCLFWILRSAY